jgi:hypothetical protein
MMLLFVALSTQAFGYYGLGGFWRASSVPAYCTTPTFVQSVPSGAAGTVGNTQTLTQTSGNLVVAAVFGWVDPYHGSVNEFFTITDTLGNTWHPLPQSLYSNYDFIQLFYAQNVTGGANTIRVVPTLPHISGLYEMDIAEYAGVAISDPVDIASGQGAASVSAPTPGSMTSTSDCPDLVVAAYFDGPAPGGHSVGSSAAWTTRTYGSSNLSNLQDNLPTGLLPHASVNASFNTSNGNSGTWVATQVAFRSQSSLVAPTAPTQLAITSTAQTLATTWTCSGALTLQAQNGSAQPTIAHTPILVSLASSGLRFYSNSGCDDRITSTQIPAGTSSKNIYFMGTVSGASAVTASATGLTSANQTETITDLIDKTWVGGAGCDGVWTTDACWKGNAPGTNDIAYFDSNCTINCTATLGANVTIKGLIMLPGCVDTINVGAHDFTVSQGLLIAGGTFNGGSQALSQNDSSMLISGGTVTLSTGTNTFGYWNHTGGTVHLRGTVTVEAGYTVGPGATLDTAGSTLRFISSGPYSSSGYALYPGTATYNNVSFLDISEVKRVIPSGSTMTVAGVLTLGTQGANPSKMQGGTILAQGNILITGNGYTIPTYDPPSLIQVAGNTDQLIDVTGATQGTIPSLEIASTGGIVKFKGNPIIAGNWTYTSGTVDFTTNNVTLRVRSPTTRSALSMSPKPEIRTARARSSAPCPSAATLF